MPLRLTVLAQGSREPALQVGFSELAFGAAGPGAVHLHPAARGDRRGRAGAARAAGPPPRATEPDQRVGDGWDTVIVGRSAGRQPGQQPEASSPKAPRTCPRSARRSAARGAAGGLITTAVATAIVTDDGRIAAGAVPRAGAHRGPGAGDDQRRARRPTSGRRPRRPGPVAARARGLRKVFGDTVAVDGVDLDVPAGAVLGMLGPNGSGKTTLIRMLLGLTRPTAGTVELLGRTVPDAGAPALPHVGALVEGPGFHPFLSGRENLLRVAAAEPLLAGERDRRRRRRGAGAGRARRRGRPPLPRLLARHEAAPRAGRGAAAAAPPGRARRADQRARPGGHPRRPADHRASCTPGAPR